MTERSPSPVAAPPIPSAPGPRATALQKLYSEAIAHIIKTCNYKNFASCFPTPSAQIPEAMQDLHEQFTSKLQSNLSRNFDELLERRGVVPHLNELDTLIEDARKRKARAVESNNNDLQQTPPHTLAPTQLYLAQLAPSLTKHSESIKAKQDILQTENVELLDRIMMQRKNIAALMAGLEAVVVDLDASAAALDGNDELSNMPDELRAVDEEMRTAPT